MIYAERLKEVKAKLKFLYSGENQWKKIQNAANDFGCHPNTMYRAINYAPTMSIIRFFNEKYKNYIFQKKISVLEKKIEEFQLNNDSTASFEYEKKNGYIIVKKIIKKTKIKNDKKTNKSNRGKSI